MGWWGSVAPRSSVVVGYKDHNARLGRARAVRDRSRDQGLRFENDFLDTHEKPDGQCYEHRMNRVTCHRCFTLHLYLTGRVSYPQRALQQRERC